MNIGQLIATLGVDTAGLLLAQEEMEKFKQSAEKNMDSVNASMEKIGKKMTDIGKTMTLFVTTPILAAGAAAFKMASDYNESLNKVQVAFGRNSKEVEAWSKTTLKSYGIAQQSALDMAALFGDMSTSMGLNTSEASKMSISLVGLAGDLASFKNIGIDQATTALAAIFTGETESLKRLGIVMTEVNLQEYAMSQGINKKIESMNQAEKVQLRYNYVLSVTKNSQGDFTRTQEGAANQMRIFGQSLKEVGNVFGQVILPVVTSWIKRINEMLGWVTTLTESQKKWVIGIAAVAAAIGPVLIGLGALTTYVFPLLLSGGAAVIGMFKSMALAMATNPITAAALAIGALVGYLVIAASTADRLSVAERTLVDIKKQATRAYADEKVKIEELVRIARADTSTKEEKAKAIQAINDISPQFLGFISQETINTKSATDAVNVYISSLERKATAQAASDLLVELETNRLKALASGEDKRLTLGQKSLALQMSIIKGTYYGIEAAKIEAQNAELNSKAYLDSKNAILKVTDQQIKKEKELGQNLIGEIEVVAAAKAKINMDVEAGKRLADIIQKVTEGERSLMTVSKAFNRDISTTGIEFNVAEDKIKLYADAIKNLAAIGAAGLPTMNAYVNKLKEIQPLNGEIIKKFGGKDLGGVVNAEGKNQVSSSAKGILSVKPAGLGTGWAMGPAGKAAIQGAKGEKRQLDMDSMAKATETYAQQAQTILASYTNLVQAQTSRQLDMVDKVAKAQGKSAEWVAKEKERIQAQANRKTKQAALAEAAINIAVGITKAIAQGGVLGIVMGAVVAAAGMMQVAAINATKMASGGIVPGGYPNDTYPALLTSGEMVVPPGKLPNLSSEKEFKLLYVNVKGSDLEYVYQERRKMNNSY